LLAAILNVPATAQEWSTWSWNHRLSHSAILQAALRQKGVSLTDYVLDPINLDHIDDWLERNQQMHVDADQLVGSQSVDLTDVDFKDPKQLQAWIYLHWQDHVTIEQRLGIGS
jgi:hypothetical protein